MHAAIVAGQVLQCNTARRAIGARCANARPDPNPVTLPLDELSSQLVALAGERSLVPDPVAAARQRENVEVADVAHRRVVRLDEATGLAARAGEAGPLEPVLVLRRPAVVGASAVREHGRDA